MIEFSGGKMIWVVLLSLSLHLRNGKINLIAIGNSRFHTSSDMISAPWRRLKFPATALWRLIVQHAHTHPNCKCLLCNQKVC